MARRSGSPAPRRSPRLVAQQQGGTSSKPSSSAVSSAGGADTAGQQGRLAMQLQGGLAATIYFCAGPSLILLNQWILRESGFPHPIALSAFGVVVSALVSHVLLRLGLVEASQPALMGDSRFYLTRSLPIAALSALTLALGNMAYVHLSVAACQILKTLTPVITLGLQSALGVESTTPALVACVMLICLGTMIASSGVLRVGSLGLALQLGANLAEASRMVLSQQLLAARKLPLLELQYHIAPSQTLCLLLAALHLELHDAATRAAALNAVAAHPLSFLLASNLGLALQVATLVVVRTSGPVTLKLLGTVRNAATVLTEVVRGRTEGTPMQLAGYTLSLLAFVRYTQLRVRGGAAPPKRKRA